MAHDADEKTILEIERAQGDRFKVYHQGRRGRRGYLVVEVDNPGDDDWSLFTLTEEEAEHLVQRLNAYLLKWGKDARKKFARRSRNDAIHKIGRVKREERDV